MLYLHYTIHVSMLTILITELTVVSFLALLQACLTLNMARQELNSINFNVINQLFQLVVVCASVSDGTGGSI